jgi:hypothetical protein
MLELEPWVKQRSAIAEAKEIDAVIVYSRANNFNSIGASMDDRLGRNNRQCVQLP